MKIMGPATFSSGMTHNLYIILILASLPLPTNYAGFVSANAS